MAISVVASSAGRAFTTNSLTVSHTVPAGSDRFLVVLCFHSPGLTLSGTYGGVALTKSSDILSPAGGRFAVLGLDDPTVGTANVALTATGGVGTICACAITLTGCGGVGGLVAQSGTGTAATLGVSSAAGELVLDIVGSSLASVNFTAGAGQTGIIEQDGLSGTNARIATSYEAGATAVTMSWTLSASGVWQQAALTASPAGAPSVPEVETLAATAITATTATLNGTGTPNGTAIDGFFRWDTVDPPVATDTTPAALGSGGTAVPFAVGLTGLTAGVTYYVRAVIDDGASETLGAVLSFVAPLARLSQLPLEVLVLSDIPIPARLSQLPLEVLRASTLDVTAVQLSQLPLEVLCAEGPALEAAATQLVTEVAQQQPSALGVTQVLIEIIKRPLGPTLPPLPPIYPIPPTGCGAGGEYPKLPACPGGAYPLLPESVCMDASTFVVNMALQEVGISKTLDALASDTSQEAYCARLIYTDVVDTVLRDFPWNFATEYADLVWLAGTVEDPVNPDWTYTYTLPTDCVRVRRVCDPAQQRRYTPTPIPFDLRADSTGLLDVLLANEPGGGQLELTDPPTISIEYTKRHTCVAQVNDAQFRECLVMKLAARLAKSLGRDSTDADRCLRNYALALPKAKTQHANDAEPQRPLEGDPDWLTGR